MTVNLNQMNLRRRGKNKVIKIVSTPLKDKDVKYKLISMILITIRVIRKGEEDPRDQKIKKLF